MCMSQPLCRIVLRSSRQPSKFDSKASYVRTHIGPMYVAEFLYVVRLGPSEFLGFGVRPRSGHRATAWGSYHAEARMRVRGSQRSVEAWSLAVGAGASADFAVVLAKRWRKIGWHVRRPPRPHCAHEAHPAHFVQDGRGARVRRSFSLRLSFLEAPLHPSVLGCMRMRMSCFACALLWVHSLLVAPVRLWPPPACVRTHHFGSRLSVGLSHAFRDICAFAPQACCFVSCGPLPVALALWCVVPSFLSWGA